MSVGYDGEIGQRQGKVMAVKLFWQSGVQVAIYGMMTFSQNLNICIFSEVISEILLRR
jgi:hypothetical protein